MNGVAQERDIRRSPKRVCDFPGHLRVRNASAEEMRGFARLFADPDRSGWVTETIATGRRSPRCGTVRGESRVPLAWTVTAADGETALALRSEEYGKGLAHEALRAAIRVLRDEPFARADGLRRAGGCEGGKGLREGRIFPRRDMPVPRPVDSEIRPQPAG